jgi:propanediol dehydratase small subunit
MAPINKEQLSELVQQNASVRISPDQMEEVVRQIMAALGGKNESAPASRAGKLSAADYPLAVKRKDLVSSATGKTLDDLTLEGVTSGQIKFEDIKTRPETLEYQAQIAESVGRPRLADNLRRAAELTRIPDEKVLDIYNSLRPYRCTKQELMDIASELEEKYQAKVCASFVREAAEVYEKNNRLKV